MPDDPRSEATEGSIQTDSAEFAPSWHGGVRTGVYNPILPKVAIIEANWLGVPSFVLNPRSSLAKNQIIYRWALQDGKTASFTFSRTGDNPFPLTIHALYLDVLLAMFANNFRADGQLNFLFSHVLQNAGHSPYSRGSRDAIYETISRYQNCHAKWEYAFDGRRRCWSGSIIEFSDLWDDQGKPRRRNPRNSKNKEQWNTVVFHSHIVESIKDQKIRCFLSDVLRSGLPPDAYCVYRHFKRFSEVSDIRRTLDHVKTAMNSKMRDSKFRSWLGDKLEQLRKAGYIERFEIRDHLVVVKLRTLRALKGGQRAEEFSVANLLAAVPVIDVGARRRR